jgi:hypothetical protein
MAEQDQHVKLRDTPGGVITTYAFNYAVNFYDFAAVKLPELKQYQPDVRCTWMQSAIIVSTLIQLERKSPGRSAALHDNVSRAFAPPARHRCLTAVQDLSAYLLKMDRGRIAPEAIPSFESLAGSDDKTLSSSIGTWLAQTITKKKELAPADQAIASTMGRSQWTSAVMIVKILQSKGLT